MSNRPFVPYEEFDKDIGPRGTIETDDDIVRVRALRRYIDGETIWENLDTGGEFKTYTTIRRFDDGSCELDYSPTPVNDRAKLN